MNQNTIQVNPSEFIPPTQIITQFRYDVRKFDFGKEITFMVSLCNSNGLPVDIKPVTMIGEDYEKWGNDDNYAINFICSTLGLTPAA